MELPRERVMKLASYGCTYKEIASFFNVGLSTVEAKYQGEYQKGKQNLKRYLRKAQLRSALVDRNVTMQIWLGKQYPGQKDATKIEVDDKSRLSLPQLLTLPEDEFNNRMEMIEQRMAGYLESSEKG